MQLFCKKWLDIAPQYSSAVTVSPQVHIQGYRRQFPHSLIDGIPLNLFSLADDGCFHIRDTILVLSVV